jgi:hypothetical protein
MNRVQVQFVALLGAATLAAPALGQTGDQVACYASSTTVKLSNTENVILNQNSPNPFGQETTITYKLPHTAKTATLLFHDAQGALIKKVDIASRGSRSDSPDDEDAECAGTGQVFVFADDLKDGLYTYALVVDGRTADSKKMVKSRYGLNREAANPSGGETERAIRSREP